MTDAQLEEVAQHLQSTLTLVQEGLYLVVGQQGHPIALWNNPQYGFFIYMVLGPLAESSGEQLFLTEALYHNFDTSLHQGCIAMDSTSRRMLYFALLEEEQWSVEGCLARIAHVEEQGSIWKRSVESGYPPPSSRSTSSGFMGMRP